MFSWALVFLGMTLVVPAHSDEICISPDHPHVRKYRVHVPNSQISDFVAKLREFAKANNYFYELGATSTESRLDILLVSRDEKGRGLRVLGKAGSNLVVGSVEYCGPGEWRSYWVQLKLFLKNYRATLRR